MKKNSPEFPIKVTFFEDNDVWILNNEDELCTNLEWFDSRDKEENAKVEDHKGRLVRVKVEELKLLELFLE